MAVALGQVCGEYHFHTTLCRYVYQPTGAGDWFRWRMCPAAAHNATYDATYFALGGVCRGQVYAGSQVDVTGSDDASGFAAGATVQGCAYKYTQTYADYREFNIPENMTHVRLFTVTMASGYDQTLVEFRTAADAVISAESVDNNVGAGLYESDWFVIPATAAKVRIRKATDDAKYIRFKGLDFINTASIVDPDTAGSVMWAGSNAPSTEVLINPYFDQSFVVNPQSAGMALYWSDRGGAYSASNSIGGNGHRGIDTCTMAWETQDGLDAPAEWAPSAGGRIACDYLIAGITTAKAYREAAKTNYRGTLTGKFLFDASGCLFDNTIAIDQLTNMDVFILYNITLAVPLSVDHFYPHGQESVFRLNNASKLGLTKAQTVEMWGGTNGTHYQIANQQADSSLAYYQRVGYSYWPRIAYVAGTPGYYKLYANAMYSTDTPVQYDNGTSISSRYAIQLRDRRFTQKRIQRIL